MHITLTRETFGISPWYLSPRTQILSPVGEIISFHTSQDRHMGLVFTAPGKHRNHRNSDEFFNPLKKKKKQM